MFAALCVLVRFVPSDEAVVNDGWIVAAVVLGGAGVFSLTSGWRMNVDEKDALVQAQQARGLRSRSRLGAAGVAWSPEPTDLASALLLSGGAA